MKKTSILAMLLAVLLLASVALAEQADDPAVVRVGDREIGLAQVQKYFDVFYQDYQNYYASMGQVFPPDEAPYLLDEIIAQYTAELVLTTKAADYGLDVVSPEEEAEMRETTSEQFEAELAEFAEYSEMDIDEARAYVDETLGYTADYYYEVSWMNLVFGRLYDHITEGIEVSDEDVQARYDEYVARDEEMFAGDVSNYEMMSNPDYAAYFGEQDIYYIPEGYRLIKHILLPVTDEVSTQLADLEADIQSGKNVLSALQMELASLENVEVDEDGENGEANTTASVRSAEQIQADIDAQQAIVDGFTARLEATKQQFIPAQSEAIDDITARYAAGESFDDLIAEYNTDPGVELNPDGYMVHKESVNYVPEFTEAAAALEKVGDLSEPLATDYGVHILLYAADAQGGALELTDALKETIREELLEERRQLAYQEAYAQWEEELTIETYPELVEIPDVDVGLDTDALIVDDAQEEAEAQEPTVEEDEAEGEEAANNG